MEESEESTGGETEGRRSAPYGAIAREIAGILAVALVVVLAASVAAEFVPAVSRYLYLIVAVVFLGLPYVWIDWNGWDYRQFGLVANRLAYGVAWGLGFAVLTAAPFAIGYWGWQTWVVGSSYQFEWENYQKWEPELEGEPAEWSTEPGVSVWTEDRAVRAGIRTGEGAEVPLTVTFSADRPFRPNVTGPVRLEAVSADTGRSRVWRATVREERGRAEVSVAPASSGTEGFPRSFDISVTDGSSAHPLRVGPGARRVEETSYEFGRGLRWIYLWLMTQVLFIALPEEYFYRGYMQTRTGDAIAAYRREKTDREEPETRSWLGISEENVVASVAFGVGHLLTPVGGAILWNRAAVAFPSIVFGWLRDRTESITAPIVYHAACNMMVLLAEPHFF